MMPKVARLEASEPKMQRKAHGCGSADTASKGGWNVCFGMRSDVPEGRSGVRLRNRQVGRRGSQDPNQPPDGTERRPDGQRVFLRKRGGYRFSRTTGQIETTGCDPSASLGEQAQDSFFRKLAMSAFFGKLARSALFGRWTPHPRPMLDGEVGKDTPGVSAGGARKRKRHVVTGEPGHGSRKIREDA